MKHTISEAPVLAFYDVEKPVTLSVDASSKGLGAIILQSGRPVAYTSKALTTPQQNYAQIEKVLAAIEFGCRKFHNLLFGRTVEVETDHKPLEMAFKKPLHATPQRLQRRRLQVQLYDLKVSGSRVCNCTLLMHCQELIYQRQKRCQCIPSQKHSVITFHRGAKFRNPYQ